MTCIIGLAEGRKVWIGGDSVVTSGWTARATASPKVFRIPPFVLGCQGSVRMAQILKYHLNVPEQEGKDDYGHMIMVFTEVVREAFKEKGFTRIEDNREEGGTFLVGYRGALYKVQSDFQVGSYVDGLAAAGCGEEFALGAMKAVENLPPRERIERSLEIAAYFSGGVRPPFVILEGE